MRKAKPPQGKKGCCIKKEWKGEHQGSIRDMQRRLCQQDTRAKDLKAQPTQPLLGKTFYNCWQKRWPLGLLQNSEVSHKHNIQSLCMLEEKSDKNTLEPAGSSPWVRQVQLSFPFLIPPEFRLWNKTYIWWSQNLAGITLYFLTCHKIYLPKTHEINQNDITLNWNNL